MSEFLIFVQILRLFFRTVEFEIVAQASLAKIDRSAAVPFQIYLASVRIGRRGRRFRIPGRRIAGNKGASLKCKQKQ